jgi:nucleoside-diphosphate-sugar epimerase
MSKTAVVSGGNGLIGRKLVLDLANNNYKVFVLGKSSELNSEITSNMGEKQIKYIRIPEIIYFEDEVSRQLCEHISEEDRTPIFYNLAWKGKNQLVDGNINDQFNNIHVGTEFVKIAAKINAVKFVNLGSLEEISLARFLKEKHNKKFELDHKSYALAKLAARDALAFESYVCKIDFVHARLSSVIDCGLKTPKYVEKTLKQILNNQEFERPRNKEIYNLCSLETIASQLVFVGEKGCNNCEYVLGSRHAFTFETYFNKFINFLKGRGIDDEPVGNQIGLFLKSEDFDNGDFFNDANSSLTEEVVELFERIKKCHR